MSNKTENKPEDLRENAAKSLSKEAVSRNKVIVRTSVIGILSNVLLAAMKATVGVMTRSIAVTLDAVNNLSDALSSVVTIIGARLANRSPDKKHPLGHGRIEYLSAMIVAAIVLYAGITALVESGKKILHPEQASYSVVSLVLIAAAVVVKILLGRYVKKQGQRTRSQALIASGADALFDAILSLSVLLSAILFMLTGLSLEAYVGFAIALFIIKSGIDMIRETADDLLGKRADPEMTTHIKKVINAFPEVCGTYDLVLNNYGPNREYGSAHIELPDTMTVAEADLLTRAIQNKVYQETGVVMTGISVYSYNSSNDEAARLRDDIQRRVKEHPWALQTHGFYIDVEKQIARFDVVLSFEIDPGEALRTLKSELRTAYPGYRFEITPDIDTSDV